MEPAPEGGLSYVYINGKPLDEPYIKQEPPRRADTSRRQCAPGQYFFMGDNRIPLVRLAPVGLGAAEDLIGKVFAIYWPPNRIGVR